MFGSSSTMRMRLAIRIVRSSFRQHHAECRTAKLALHQRDVAAVKQCTLSSDRQTQAHPSLLESDRRLEERASGFLAQPWPGIVNLDSHFTIHGACRY